MILRYIINKRNIVRVGITVLVLLLMKSTNVFAAITSNLPTSTISDTFPASYNSYINSLKQAHPNWNFKAVNTGLDWDTVVYHETYECNPRISLIHDSYGDEWKKDGKNDYKDGPYVVASKDGVKYVLDPRNSLNDEHIFQFEYLGYNGGINSSVIDKVLSNVMSSTYRSQYKNAGNWLPLRDGNNNNITYSQMICDISRTTGVSAVYIAALIMQETSGDIVNNKSVNGSVDGYTGLYNFFNIGSTPNADGSGAIINGLISARNRGWTNPYLSIKGGVEEIKKQWIDFGQYTIYFKKFDVNNPYGNAKALMKFQYQTNILAPRSESKTTYNAYKAAGMLNDSFVFYIPVYNNMPQNAATYPSSSSAYYEDDNTKVIYPESETSNLNLRSGPSTSSSIVVKLAPGAIMTRTKKGVNTGWDYVEIIINGEKKSGYVFSEYISVYNYTKVQSVSLNTRELRLELGGTSRLTATINPSNAVYKNISWDSNNPNVATVSNDGVITAKQEGTATITVRTEDQNKTDTCIVTVKKKSPSISFDKSIYTVMKGNSSTFNINIIDTELKEYTIDIKDKSIAEIQNNKIIGLKEGTTEVEVKLNNSEIKAKATIKVIDLGNVQIDIDESLNVNDDVITKISPETTVDQILQKVKSSTNQIKIKNMSGEEISNNSLIGTGSTINVIDNNSQTIYSYNVIIYGDPSGDGKITSRDYMMIKNHIMGTSAMTGIFNLASDAYEDKEVTSKDYMMIKNHIMGTQFINQR